MRKKLLCTALIVSLCALSLTGCKKKSDDSVAPAQETENTQETETPEEEPAAEEPAEESNDADEQSGEVAEDEFWEDATELVKDNWEGGYISKVFISVEDGIEIDATYEDAENGDTNMVVPVSVLLDKLQEKYPDEATRIKDAASLVSTTTGIDMESLVLSAEQLADYLGYEILFQDETGICFTKAFQTKRLILSGVTDTINADDYKATTVLDSGDGMIVMQFDSIEDTKAAYEALVEKYGEDSVREDRVVSIDDYASLEEVDAYQAFPWYDAWTKSDYYSWGAIRIGADQFVENMSDDAKKEEIVVAVLDTGLDPTNSLFDNRVVPGYSYTYNTDDTMDYEGHGTHVAGTILDLTRGTNIKVMPIQVLFEDGAGSELSVLYGLYDAIQMGVDVINMSLGIPVMYQEDADLEDELVQEATDAGILIVCAAGNDNIYTENICPAHLDNVLCVGMTDIADARSFYSNYGFSVDISAPGQEIYSAYLNGDIYPLEGTSMASPHVAASAALIKASGIATTPEDISNVLQIYADDAGYPGKDVFYGSGIVNLARVAEYELGGTSSVGDTTDDGNKDDEKKDDDKKVDDKKDDDKKVDDKKDDGKSTTSTEGYVEVQIQRMTTIDQKHYYVISFFTEDDIKDYTVMIDGADYTKQIKSTSNATKYTLKLDSIGVGKHTLTVEMNGNTIFEDDFSIEK